MFSKTLQQGRRSAIYNANSSNLFGRASPHKMMGLPAQRQFSAKDDISTDEFYKQVFSRVDTWMKLRDQPIVTHNTPVSEMRKVDISIPQKGEGLTGALQGIDTFMEHAVRAHHPAFMNQVWGGLNPASFAGEVISTLCQTSMYTYELAPLATLIELEVLKQMAGFIGPSYKDASGVFTTGGSNGNMLGFLMARQSKFPESLTKGYDGSKICVFVSEESHYSQVMSANVIGMGYDNLIKVGTDQDGKMCMNELRMEVEKCKAAGKVPLAVVGTAGTTVRGCYDPLRDIAGICKEEDMWFHVDGAWGGNILFSPTHRHHADGGDLADSWSWDTHKLMGIPLICSTFIAKDVSLLNTLCGHSQTAHYLLHKDTADCDLGHRSLQCGRRNDALKFWCEWKNLGDEGFAKVVDDFVGNAQLWQEKVEEHPRMEMMSERVYVNAPCRYNPTPGSTAHGIDLNELNIEIRDKLLKTGKFMIGRANIRDDVILRPVFCNAQTTRKTIDDLFDEIIKIGDELVESEMYQSDDD